MNLSRPWSDDSVLAAELAGWRERWAGRPLFRVTAGRDWVRLGLEGDSRPGILLTNLPGACLVLAHEGSLAPPVTAAMPATRNHPLSRLLDGAVFSSCAMFPDDLVAAFRLELAEGRFVYLVHQLFGSRGNMVLLDDRARLLWARHRPPHSLLASVPPEKTWSQGQAADARPGLSSLMEEHLTDRLLRTVLQETRSELNRRLKSARRLVDNLTRDHDSAEQGELYRLRAEALAAHLHEISQGAPSVVLVDPRSGDPVEIAMDPALTPAANMEAWFRRARKADKGRQVIAGRLATAQGTLAVIEQADLELRELADESAGATDLLDRIHSWRAEHVDILPKKKSSSAAGRYGPEEPARAFRRYLVDGRWEVWVGRNNKENDELTHRASHSRDIWLHAQGVPGSHVILRTAGKPEQVPRLVLEKAAGLAALNSKARHSELVPVVFTERRYVRKPRKAPAGTAVCLREKSLFVSPGLAAGVTAV